MPTFSRQRHVITFASRRWSSTLAAGFAGLPQLLKPDDWSRLERNAVEECNSLVNVITSTPPSHHTVGLLDDISDIICRVVDAAEFCRNVHSDLNWQRAAQETCLSLGAYVQSLNMHTGLYTALSSALHLHRGSNSACATTNSGWSSETFLVGKMLLRDFERCGVHLTGTPHGDAMQSLTRRSQELGMHITQNINNPDSLGALRLNNTSKLPRNIEIFGERLISASSSVLYSVLQYSDDEENRKSAFYCLNNTPDANTHLFKELVSTRKEIAQLAGYSSWAEYQLDGFSLAATPRAVHSFLSEVLEKASPLIDKDAHTLQKFSNKSVLEPWDRLYYSRLVKEKGTALKTPSFPLRRVLEVLTLVLNTFLGIRMQPVAMKPGEGWAKNIRKLELFDAADERPLGIIYLDLESRPHKAAGGAAHYTLRCARKRRDGQTAVVALVASGLSEWQYLSISDIENLFHEIGHAVHSLLSMTEYQHLSGTRGPLDIIELPSQLFQMIGTDPRILQMMSSEDTSWKEEDIWSMRRGALPGLDIFQQISLTKIDQLLHGEDPVTDSIAERLPPCPGFALETRKSHPYVRFGHAVGYGGTYHGYLYSDCLAHQAWQRYLNDDPLNEASGTLLKNKLFGPGGAKEAACLVRDLFVEDKSVLRGSQDDAGWWPNSDALLSHKK